MSQMREKLFRATTQVLCLLAAASWAARAGDLEPPGPPGPTMKPLSAVEPRIPIHPDMLPLTITQPGSYYLTGPVETTGGGITIDVNNVTLDLMGFTLKGGTGNGITAVHGRRFITVRNGTVRGWSQHGIALGDLAIVEKVIVEGNNGNGIQLISQSRIADSTVADNSGHGITVGADNIVARCVATGNGENGIWAANKSLITDSIAYANQRAGIRVDWENTVSRCRADWNDPSGSSGRAGIWATGSGNRIEENTTSLNTYGLAIEGNDNLVVRNFVVTARETNYFVAPGTSGNICDIRTDLTGAGPWWNFSK